MKATLSSETTRKLAAPPVSIRCLVCHGQFFPASLPIHQKTCFQRNDFVLVPCERCMSCVRAFDFHSHTASCTGKSLSFDNKAPRLQSDTIKRRNAPTDLNLPEADGRVRCKTCERAFSQDRIAKHQSICHGKSRSLKENHEPRQRFVIPPRQPQEKQHIEPSRRKTNHIQRAFASRPQELSCNFVSGRNTPEVLQQFRTTAGRQSCSYPGARGMQGGGCSTSNASSTSNPLATNPLMTMRK